MYYVQVVEVLLVGLVSNYWGEATIVAEELHVTGFPEKEDSSNFGSMDLVHLAAEVWETKASMV